MKLKVIVIAMGVAAVSLVHADANSQLSSLQAQVNQLQAQINSMNTASGSAMSGVVGLDSALSMQMMDNQSGVGKELTLLRARQNGLNQTLTLGGYAQGDAVYDNTNTKVADSGVFINPGISANNVGNNASSATRLFLTDTSLATTVAMGSWVTGYMQVGQTNIGGTSNTSTSFGVQDSYLVFGNLARLPVYGFVGDKDIDFGNFSTVDIYNQPLTRTLFQAHGNAAGVGVNAYGFNAVLSAMNGGRQSHTPVSVGSNLQYEKMATSNNSGINNFAANLSYGMTSGAISWDVGAGYLHGASFFNTSPPSGGTNAAWDVNGKISAYGFDLLGEYGSSIQDTYASTIGFGGTVPQRASAWDVGADYNFAVMGLSSVVNVDYSGASLANQNGDGNQYVVGYRVEAVHNVWAGVEYAYTTGIANYLASVYGVSSLAGVTTTATNGNNVKNSTVALDITAAF